MQLKFLALDRTFNRDFFDCGIIELNTFIKNTARQQQTKNLNKTFVLIDEEKDPSRILAYYSISMCEVHLDAIPDNVKHKLPKYPLPAARIGRLAVDKNFQQERLGKLALVDALARIKKVSLNIGVYAVVVDAKNDLAKSFYKKFGFCEFEDNTSSLFLPLSTLPG